MELTYNQVARRLFHELRSVYPSPADIPFESFLKSDVGLSDTEIKGIYKMDECHFEPSEQRLKEIISCEMHQLQIYYSENFDIEEGLAKLKPINPDGFVTAGNASGINDGAAAVVVMTEEKAKELGVTPMAEFVAGALAGVDPSIMGIGPVAATRKVMDKTGMKIEDFDIYEANEAFAAQSVAVGKDLGFDLSKLNINGGAIALGHPVGASGARILVTLLHNMKRTGAKTGLATLCIGGGMGCATIVKAVE